ncbi:hypothetical protein GUITHDRAFT_165482 [Guillardia theta CCMP2712]|uniref:HTH myb-type domain-containing protein n=1 Tax=Guillardia theta (strain CCMP2712) TaxID=905079 RepID=L1IMH2_GUITC|nr:hypothetical protein GUITHDRAFT_165482 [Guillardia theta CCMP2712]EKX37456.1 hypothetical protein GUITHDRAFT_165482 [Guillardia theta CCMP2712]|eukprot:XP_005824436.1 hypothetical protein GUITHDRAFT_165482 [Guillardia theta CCMP2712]
MVTTLISNPSMWPLQGGNGTSCAPDVPLSAPISNLSLSASLLLLNQRTQQAQSPSTQLAANVGLPWLVSSQLTPTMSLAPAHGGLLNDLAASSSPTMSGLFAQTAQKDMAANARDIASLLSFKLGNTQGAEDRKDLFNMNASGLCPNPFMQASIGSSNLMMPHDNRNLIFGLGSNLAADQLSQHSISNNFVSSLAARESPGMNMSAGHSSTHEEGERTNSMSYGVRSSSSPLTHGGSLDGAATNARAKAGAASVKKEKEERGSASPQSPSSGDEQPGKSSSRKRPLEAGEGGSSTKRCSRYWTKEEHEIFLKALKKYHRPQGPSPNNRVRVGLGEGVAELIAAHVKTRSPAQVRSHAQKYFIRESKVAPHSEDPEKSP